MQMLKAEAGESERAFQAMKDFPVVVGLGDDGKIVTDAFHPPLSDNYDPVWHKGAEVVYEMR